MFTRLTVLPPFFKRAMALKIDTLQVGLLCDERAGRVTIPKDAIESLAGEFPPVRTRVLVIDQDTQAIGNEHGKRMRIYDPIKDRDELLPYSMPSVLMPGRTYFMMGTALNDNRVLLCSNHVDSSGVVPYAFIFDPFTSRFGRPTISDYSFLSTEDCTNFACRTTASLVTLLDGRVLRVGGFKGMEMPGDCALFTPSTKTWVAVENHPVMPTGAFSVVLDDGRVLISGGAYQSQNYSTLCWLYDPSTGVFVVTGTLHKARARHSGCLLATGDVFICGGVDSSPNNMFSGEIYNVQTGTWKKLDKLHIHCADHRCIALPDGTISIVEKHGRTSFYDPFGNRPTRAALSTQPACVIVVVN
jgi:hypothetical protein